MSYIPAPLRRRVRWRARGACEYCLVPDGIALVSHHVDHVIALKHGGTTDADNLAYSCISCNKRKGSDLTSLDPETSALTPLFNPRLQRWSDHFQLVDKLITPWTPCGRATAWLLQLNHPDRLHVRALLLGGDMIQVPE